MRQSGNPRRARESGLSRLRSVGAGSRLARRDPGSNRKSDSSRQRAGRCQYQRCCHDSGPRTANRRPSGISRPAKAGRSAGFRRPPLFLGGRVLGCGRGEEVYPLSDLPSRSCLVIFPGFSVSTADAYREAGLRLTEQGGTAYLGSFGAWPHFPLMSWGPAENDFEYVVFARWPELARLKRQLIRAGAEVASMTGSGSAVYALFSSSRQMDRASKLIPKGWLKFPTRTLVRADYHRRLFVH